MQGFETYLRNRHFRESTIRKYVQTAQFYEDERLNLDVSLSRYKVVTATLKQYAEYLDGVESRKVLKFIADSSAPKKVHKAPERPLTLEQWKALYDRAEKMEKPQRYIMLLLVYSGLRVGDIGRIERKNILLSERNGYETLTIEVKQGKFKDYPWDLAKDFIVPMAREIKGWESVYELLSETEDGYYKRVYRMLKELAADAGLEVEKVHPHLLRRTFAVMVLEETDNLEYVRQLLMHDDIRTTQGYVNWAKPKKLVDIVKRMDKKRFSKDKDEE